MYEHLEKQPEDKILQVINQFREDERPFKVDLGVGVYRNEEGITPIMRSVKEAEKRIWELEQSKTYTQQPKGGSDFLEAMKELVLGEDFGTAQIASAATPGGTGAVRQALEFSRLANPEVTVWVSAPTWQNHPSILDHLNMKWSSYRYFDALTRAVDFEGMTRDLAQAGAGDIVLIHGCCHNPTGANLYPWQWEELAQFLKSKSLIPFIDLAYQGFGDGLEEDAVGVRALARHLPETLIAVSCSKNFGVYKERTGAVMVVVKDGKHFAAVQSTLDHLNLVAYSFPPDHGTRVVATILNDRDLRADWEQELADIRESMISVREELARELRKLTGSDRFGFLAEHRGMFSRLGATPEQVELMRRDHAVYLVPDSRLNIAGLSKTSVPRVAQAIVDTGV